MTDKSDNKSTEVVNTIEKIDKIDNRSQDSKDLELQQLCNFFDQLNDRYLNTKHNHCPVNDCEPWNAGIVNGNNVQCTQRVNGIWQQTEPPHH